MLTNPSRLSSVSQVVYKIICQKFSLYPIQNLPSKLERVMRNLRKERTTKFQAITLFFLPSPKNSRCLIRQEEKLLSFWRGFFDPFFVLNFFPFLSPANSLKLHAHGDRLLLLSVLRITYTRALLPPFEGTADLKAHYWTKVWIALVCSKRLKSSNLHVSTYETQGKYQLCRKNDVSDFSTRANQPVIVPFSHSRQSKLLLRALSRRIYASRSPAIKERKE